MREITKADWVKYFPFGAPRPEQTEAIDFALNTFFSGKKFAILECPTGVGKSAIAVTISRYLTAHDPPPPDAEYGFGTYILTTQKILQEQYIDDFMKFDLESIKSSSNYQCRHYVEQSCAESLRILEKMESRLQGTPFYKQCKGACAYKEQKTKFLQAEMGCTNFSYFMAETMYGGALTPRQLLVCDEAHNIESELTKFVAVRVEPDSEREPVKIKLPSLKDQAAAFAWITQVYHPALSKLIEKTAKKIAKDLLKSDKPSRSLLKLMKENEHLDKHICKINRFIESYVPSYWVLNQEPGKAIEFKPVDVSKHADWHLFKHAPRTLLMSATIMDHEFYCESLGIPLDQMGFKSFDSPFPVKHRPVHYMPVGKMNAAEIDATLPKMVEAVKMILELHKGEKGIVFAHSYKILNALKDGIKSDRMLYQTSGDMRDRILWEHARVPEPTVLVSPSMTEGVDLRDDLSRFQIMTKVPFPYIDDFVKRKMAMSPKWYPFVTARTVVQAAGRSIRNETDHATTYIIDGSWEWFCKQNRKMFPEYFLKSLQ